MLGRKRFAVAGAARARGAAPAAQAAVPDTWTRWAAAPQDTPIRSLDWAAGLLYAAGDGAGVFWSTNQFGPWQQKNTGLEDPNAKAVRQVKGSPNGLLYAATTAGLFSPSRATARGRRSARASARTSSTWAGSRRSCSTTRAGWT